MKTNNPPPRPAPQPPPISPSSTARMLPFPPSLADKVRTRQCEITPEQQAAVDAFWQSIRPLCENPEQAIAVLMFSVSEFLLRVAKPEMLPAAVATAVECLRINTGVVVPIPAAPLAPSRPPQGEWPRSQPKPPQGVKPG